MLPSPYKVQHEKVFLFSYDKIIRQMNKFFKIPSVSTGTRVHVNNMFKTPAFVSCPCALQGTPWVFIQQGFTFLTWFGAVGCCQHEALSCTETFLKAGDTHKRDFPPLSGNSTIQVIGINPLQRKSTIK